MKVKGFSLRKRFYKLDRLASSQKHSSAWASGIPDEVSPHMFALVKGFVRPWVIQDKRGSIHPFSVFHSHTSIHARKSCIYQFGSSSVSAIRPLLQLDLDLAQRHEVLGRQEQNVSTKCVSPLRPLVKSRVNSLDNSSNRRKECRYVERPLSIS